MAMRSKTITPVLASVALMFQVNVVYSDTVVNDDLIVAPGTGGLCVGFDCIDGEVFGFDTLVLKEDDVAVHFDDTSTAPGDPANDWRIVINDSTAGGANHFSIVDATSNVTVLRLCAVSETNCDDLFVPGYYYNQLNLNRAAITDNALRLDRLAPSIDENTDGIALALALGNGADIRPGQNTAVSFNYGRFSDRAALALSILRRIDGKSALSAGLGMSLESDDIAGRIGYSHSF